jgi:hypothetical protein
LQAVVVEVVLIQLVLTVEVEREDFVIFLLKIPNLEITAYL